MIWESKIIMTVVDLMIITAVAVMAVMIFRRRELLNRCGLFRETWLILSGLVVFGAHYLADLLVMLVLPMFMGQDLAMNLMETLHLEIAWLTSLTGVSLICIGFARIVIILLRSNSNLVAEFSGKNRAEEQLRASRDELRLITDNIPAIVIYVDWEERYRFMNKTAENWYGRRANELIGTTVRENLGESAYRELDASMKLALGGEEVHFERFIHYPDGGERHVDLIFIPDLDEDGTVRGFFALGNDITERKQAEEERKALDEGMRHTQKLESLGVLAGGIAHDFNNILMGVLGNADMARKLLPHTSPAMERIKGIEVAARRAADLCQQMLAYSGRGQFVIEPTDLNRVVEDMIHLLEASISKNSVLKCNFTQDLPAINADVTQIRQVLMNLIINASEAIGDKSGVINCTTTTIYCNRNYLREMFMDDKLPEGMYVALEISDTGHGIDKENLDKIFDPFYSTKFTGRGLGLAALLGIVRSHKGAVKVYSEVNRGTTFKLIFPASEQPAVGTPAHPEGHPVWKGSGTILVVDDEETIRTMTGKMVEMMGFSVLTAADGREALDIYKEHGKDIVCVILDLTMPHIGGEETLRQLRQLNPEIRVILSSGYNEQEVRERFTGKNITGFLQKPYVTENLEQILREVLNG